MTIRFLFIVTIVITLAAILPGCKKKSNSASYSMNATINGAPFAGTNSFATNRVDSILNIYGGFFAGTALTYPYIALNINPYRGIGTYSIPLTVPAGTINLNYAAIDSNGYYSPNTMSAYGTINITATAPNITGTFSFTARDSTRVSGSFIAQAP